MLKRVDRLFLGITVSLLVVGIFIFVSASLGVLAKSEEKFTGIIANQLILGVGAGLVAAVLALRIPLTFWKKNAFFIMIAACALSILVYIPALSLSHGGANRWVSIGPISFQPAEFLKIAAVIYIAGWYSWIKKKIDTPTYGLLPIVGVIGISGMLLLPQPDTKSLVLIIIAVTAVAFVAGLKWKYLAVLVGGGLIALAVVVMVRPYAFDRVETFLHPGHDPLGSSYQIRQSLIAIGSGGVFGRGLGQSVQKFSYLPEPQGDSVFAVVGEEFGFVGSTLLILLFVAFTLRGYRIANNTHDPFGRYLVIGLITLLSVQSFMNIASIIGIFPLTGVPLVFVSHGGTSLMFSLFAAGIILRVSKGSKA